MHSKLALTDGALATLGWHQWDRHDVTGHARLTLAVLSHHDSCVTVKSIVNHNAVGTRGQLVRCRGPLRQT